MPTRIQNPRAVAGLVARYGVKGRYTLSLDDVVVPVHVVGQDDVSAVKPAGYKGSVFVAAAAGVFGYLELQGTANTRMLLDRIRVRDTVGGQYELRFSLVQTVAASVFNLTDVDKSRLNAPPSGVSVSGRRAVAVVGTVIGRYQHNGTDDLIVDLDGFELGTEGFLTLNKAVVNESMGFNIDFRTAPNE